MASSNGNNFESTVGSLFKGMDNFITTKTVVGEAISMPDGSVLLPLVDVSFGVAAGAFANSKDAKNNGGGGMGGKIQPSAVIIIKDGNAKLVNVKSQDGLTKILDLVPDIMSRFDKSSKKKDEKAADESDITEE